MREGEETPGWTAARSSKSWRKGPGEGVTKVCRWPRKHSAAGRGLRAVWDAAPGEKATSPDLSRAGRPCPPHQAVRRGGNTHSQQVVSCQLLGKAALLFAAEGEEAVGGSPGGTEGGLASWGTGSSSPSHAGPSLPSHSPLPPHPPPVQQAQHSTDGEDASHHDARRRCGGHCCPRDTNPGLYGGQGGTWQPVPLSCRHASLCWT